MISSLAWVPKGASKRKPLRYEVSQIELEEMLREQGLEDVEEEEIDKRDGGRGEDKDELDGDAGRGSGGNRAAKSSAKGEDAKENVSDLPPELRMDDYDDEPSLSVAGEDGRVDAMDEDDDGDDEDGDDDEEEDEEEEEEEGVNFVEETTTGQVFAYESEDEDSDAEDSLIKPTDHVLLTAGTEEDEHSTLEVQVYSEETGNLYVHHDIALPSLPLCLAWMDIPPRTAAMLRAAGSVEEGHSVGSYCAVGTFEPGIEIWNLDVLDPLEPTATLGGYQGKEKKPGKKARKRPTKPGSHTDAVISLSWNREHRHVLASGSGDNSVKLWDVTTQQCSATLTHHDDKVQGVTWHPFEATVMATVGYDRILAVLDARVPTSVTRHPLQADPECLLWNPHNPVQILSGSEDGVVCCRDVRRAEDAVYSFTAHEKGVSALSFTPRVPGMLATCSEDKTVRVWDVDAEVPLQIGSRSMAVGKLFAMQYDPPTAFLLATAGSKGHVALWHSDDDEAIEERFSARVTEAASALAPAAAAEASAPSSASAEGGALAGFFAGAGKGNLPEGLGEAGAARMDGAGETREEEAEVEVEEGGGGAGGKKKKKKKKRN